jgi:hypothetical protein
LKEGKVLEKINELVLIFHLYLFQDSFIDIFRDHSEMALGEAFYSGSSWFIVYESKFTEGLTHS